MGDSDTRALVMECRGSHFLQLIVDTLVHGWHLPALAGHYAKLLRHLTVTTLQARAAFNEG